MTLGGGWGVVTTDACLESGLEVPPLSDELIVQIDQLLPDYWSRTNPVDMVGEGDPSIPLKVVEALVKWDGCDAVIHLGAVGRGYMAANMIKAYVRNNPDTPREFQEAGAALVETGEKQFFERVIRLMEEYKKPIIGIRLLDSVGSKIIYEIPDAAYKSVSFLTPERGVKVLAKMVEYAEWLRDVRH